MDPLSALGALASAVQLFDISIKYSHQACTFVSALKHSKEEAAHLQTSLQEANTLMRNLQTYASALQRPSPTSSIHQTTLARPIMQISQQFANDMVLLHQLLPKDLSMSFLKRAIFVLRKSETEKVLQRLEQRKSAAALALGIIGRMDDIQLQASISSLQTELHRISLQQKAAIENHGKQRDAEHLKFKKREAETVDLLKELQNNIAQTNNETAHQHEILTSIQRDVTSVVALQNDSVSSYQRLEAAVQSLRELQTAVVAQQRETLTSKSNLEAKTIYALTRLVRAELRVQLEPVLHRIDGVADHIDSIVMEIATKANAETLFERKADSHSLPALGDACAVHVDELISPADFAVSPNSARNRSKHNPGPREIRLFSYYTEKKIPGALHICIRLRTYRLREHLMADSQTRFFHLRVDIIPEPWLSTCGLSVIYSSSPDHRGYYSICPSIAPFGVIFSQRVFDLIRSDDVEQLRMMIEQGHLGLRDKTQGGIGLLGLSMIYKAPIITHYLLRDTGSGQELIEQDLTSRTNVLWYLLGCLIPAINTPVISYNILSFLEEFAFHEEITAKDSFSGWYSFYLSWKDLKNGHHSPDMVEIVDSARLMVKYKDVVVPFFSIPEEGLQLSIFLVKLHLNIVGNPNMPDEYGDPPLLCALASIDALARNNGWIQCKPLRERDYDEIFRFWDEAVELLTILIRAGADVYLTGPWTLDNSGKAYSTLTRLACDGFKMEGIWAMALESCGLDIDAVRLESDRRLSEYLKLHGAVRSGVDVETLVEGDSPSELRRRKPRHPDALGTDD